MHKLTVNSQIEVNKPVEEAFAFHANLTNLNKVIPNFLEVKIDRIDLPLREGSKGKFSVWLFNLIFLFKWDFEITGYEGLNYFTDEAQSGLFQYFAHTHQFIPINSSQTLLKDEIQFCFNQNSTILNKIMAFFIQLALKVKLHTTKNIMEKIN